MIFLLGKCNKNLALIFYSYNGMAFLASYLKYYNLLSYAWTSELIGIVASLAGEAITLGTTNKNLSNIG